MYTIVYFKKSGVKPTIKHQKASGDHTPKKPSWQTTIHMLQTGGCCKAKKLGSQHHQVHRGENHQQQQIETSQAMHTRQPKKKKTRLNGEIELGSQLDRSKGKCAICLSYICHILVTEFLYRFVVCLCWVREFSLSSLHPTVTYSYRWTKPSQPPAEFTKGYGMVPKGQSRHLGQY